MRERKLAVPPFRLFRTLYIMGKGGMSDHFRQQLPTIPDKNLTIAAMAPKRTHRHRANEYILYSLAMLVASKDIWDKLGERRSIAQKGVRAIDARNS